MLLVLAAPRHRLVLCVRATNAATNSDAKTSKTSIGYWQRKNEDALKARKLPAIPNTLGDVAKENFENKLINNKNDGLHVVSNRNVCISMSICGFISSNDIHDKRLACDSNQSLCQHQRLDREHDYANDHVNVNVNVNVHSFSHR